MTRKVNFGVEVSLSSWRAWIEIRTGLGQRLRKAIALLMESVD